jgi:aminoglycoside phosphotransferase (APT) family kinase protein
LEAKSIGARKAAGGDGRPSVEFVAQGLAKFYQKRHATWSRVTVHDVVDHTSGWETELYGFTLRYGEASHTIERRLAARLYAGRGVAEKAQHEFGVMRRLKDAGYPVPAVHDIETDLDMLGAPFLTMDWIEGHSMLDDFLRTPRTRLGPHLEAFTRLFVDLHRVDPAQVFPESLRSATTTGYLDHALARTRRELATRGPPWLEPVLDWLTARKDGVAPGRFAVLHRDFHPGNVMVRADGSPLVIDWSAALVGDYREDLMWTVLLASAFWGRPFGEAIFETYQRAAGVAVKNARFFEVAAIYRRIQDTSISLMKGAAEAGMRVGAAKQMREGIAHLHRVHDFLEEKTGTRLAEFDKILRTAKDSP